MAEKEILRGLAKRVAEIAALPIQQETRRRYIDSNSLRRTRPLVLLDELPWNQLNGNGELTLQCEDPFLRETEGWFRRLLWRWTHCRGDLLVEPEYPLQRDIRIGSMGIEVREQTLAADKGNHIISHHYEDQLPGMEALEKLHMPEISVDDEATAQRKERLEAIFGDILPVRVKGLPYAGHFMPWDDLSRWRGVEPILMDLYDDPEFMHAFVRKYTDIKLAVLQTCEERNLLDASSPFLHCTPGLVDGLPGPMPGGRVTRANLWGRGAAQIFAVVSPTMHNEFEIEYAKEYFAGFGLVYYGCCEPLHQKIDIVKRLPRLRKISITPWADVRKAAEQMGPRLVLSRKPNPAAVAGPSVDENELRKDLLETLRVCRETNTPCEFVLKDISSCGWNPENLTVWERVAMETIRHFD